MKLAEIWPFCQLRIDMRYQHKQHRPYVTKFPEMTKIWAD